MKALIAIIGLLGLGLVSGIVLAVLDTAWGIVEDMEEGWKDDGKN